MKDKKTFGSFIKEKRINKNYSQKDLAELLYVTESAVSKWERGMTYPDITLITDICRVLEISEKELIESSDDHEYRKTKENSDRFNKIKKVTFWALNICYLIAIITCFIVNLAVNHTLSWFFVVLASILVAYTFCPTVTWTYYRYKKLIFVGSTFLSLFVLFLTCSIYTKNYWFMIAASAVLLGYFIVFYPILFVGQKKYMKEDKYNNLSKWFLLTYSIGILFLIILLLVFIFLYDSFNLGLGILIAGVCMSLPIAFGILLSFNRSKTTIKATILSLVGIAIIIFIAAFVRELHIKSTVETKQYVITEVYSKVDIDVQIEDVNIYLSQDENKVVCLETNDLYLETKVLNDTLIIKRIDNRKFYDRIFNFNLVSYKLDLYLTIDMIESLNISCDTGDVAIHEGFTFKNVDIVNSTGDIRIFNCDKLGDVNVKTSTGDIELINIKCNKLDIETSTGKTKLSNTLVENDFNMKGSTGNLYLDGFDAKNLYIELSTGDVKGTILSSKFFIAKSDTGRVNVPTTREGGECIITVSTGDIDISYK